ncbi:uncharacterized protein C12orf76 homolog [Hemicordylus capensis]|uniref:uncharacterized protein C12orf76 homolog n=1 Tax=Hemicordylus capensis TaxID=884348 RepID=UPI002304C724|nr:uncharacterized protein C12orf76 homolog [Hemicordylus capensis]
MLLRRGACRPPLAAMLLLLLPGAGAGQEEEEGTPPSPPRPYAVLRSQNLVLMGSVFSILLIAMVLMAVCIYKPIRRR